MIRRTCGAAAACLMRARSIRACSVRMLFAVAALLALVAGPARAEVFSLSPQQQIIGVGGTLQARHEDTLPDLARLHHLGFDEIVASNPGVDKWLPGEGTQVILPTQHIVPDVPRAGIVINLSAGRLFYFLADAAGHGSVQTYPVSVGQVGRAMPLGLTKVVAKQKKPTWYPPKSIRDRHIAEGDPLPASVPPGPENPLGEYALRLGIPSGAYLIHGTNLPVSVGLQITNGCIRLYPEDIEVLFKEVPVGTGVRVVNQRMLTGWSDDGALYLEVHHPLEGTEASNVEDLNAMTRLVESAVARRRVIIDWDSAEKAFQEQRGEPVRISIDRWRPEERPRTPKKS